MEGKSAGRGGASMWDARDRYSLCSSQSSAQDWASLSTVAWSDRGATLAWSVMDQIRDLSKADAFSGSVLNSMSQSCSAGPLSLSDSRPVGLGTQLTGPLTQLNAALDGHRPRADILRVRRSRQALARTCLAEAKAFFGNTDELQHGIGAV